MYSYLKDQEVNVSVWCESWQISNILHVVVASLLNQIKHELTKNGVKNASLSGQGGIYNYEFNQTLFGSEFNLKFTNSHKDIDVDSSVNTINTIKESREGITGTSKPEFIGKGE